MRNDNKLECKEVELYARDSQNLLSVVLSDPVCYPHSPNSVSFQRFHRADTESVVVGRHGNICRENGAAAATK